MNRARIQLPLMAMVFACAVTVRLAEEMPTRCTEKNGYDFPSAGIAEVLNPGAFEIEEIIKDEEEELNISEKFDAEEKRMLTEIAMANVSNTLNVRADASEEADRVGFLYRDCGGTILEQKDGWTKIKSGGLTGWCSDEFLVFEDDAVSLAKDVGQWLVVPNSEAVRVRSEASNSSDVVTVMSKSDIADFVEIIDDNWISVDCGGDFGYVNSEYVDISFHIDEGETIEQVQTRNKIEEQLRKAAEEAARLEAEKNAKKQTTKTTTTKGAAVAANADETRLLAALIYCEAGNQPYEGMVAVGAVVMNRVKSPAYPNSIYSVIYASGQFTPAMSGKVAAVYEKGPNATVTQAALEALSGVSPVGGATHFRRNNGHAGIVIGAHVFW